MWKTTNWPSFSSLFLSLFLSGLRKQVIYVQTHDKSISKLDLITVLKVFSCKDTARFFLLYSKSSLYVKCHCVRYYLEICFQVFIFISRSFLSSSWFAPSWTQLTSRKREIQWNVFLSYSTTHLIVMLKSTSEFSNVHKVYLRSLILRVILLSRRPAWPKVNCRKICERALNKKSSTA